MVIDMPHYFGVYFYSDSPNNKIMYPMPKSLSDAQTRNAKPRTKPYKISDGEGLFLLITPSGSKYWRLKYFLRARRNCWHWAYILKSTWLTPASDVRKRARCSPPATTLGR